MVARAATNSLAALALRESRKSLMGRVDRETANPSAELGARLRRPQKRPLSGRLLVHPSVAIFGGCAGKLLASSLAGLDALMGTAAHTQALSALEAP